MLLGAGCAESPTSNGESSGIGDDSGRGSGAGAESGTDGLGGSGGAAPGTSSSSGDAARATSSSGGLTNSSSGPIGHDASAMTGSSSGTSSSSGVSSGGATSSSSGGASSSSTGGASTDAATGGADASSSSSGGSTANSCTKSNAVCMASNTGCNVGSYYLYDNQWNCGGSTGNHCGPESAYGCANNDGSVSFVVTSNQPAGNTAVLSYPAIQDNFNSKPALSSFKTISASFSETSPHVGDYEVAWDCWFNNNANEFMIWVDNYNQVPAGNKVATNVSLGGRSYDVWWSPSSGTGGYVVFYANRTVTSGTFDLLQIFKYAVMSGWLPASSTVDQLSFGIEVCSTNGQDATWSISNYSITTN